MPWATHRILFLCSRFLFRPPQNVPTQHLRNHVLKLASPPPINRLRRNLQTLRLLRHEGTAPWPTANVSLPPSCSLPACERSSRAPAVDHPSEASHASEQEAIRSQRERLRVIHTTRDDSHKQFSMQSMYRGQSHYSDRTLVDISVCGCGQ